MGGGIGLMGGVGYEGWIAEQWSMGGTFRVTYTSARSKAREGEDEIEASAVVPGVLFAITYH